MDLDTLYTSFKRVRGLAQSTNKEPTYEVRKLQTIFFYSSMALDYVEYLSCKEPLPANENIKNVLATLKTCVHNLCEELQRKLIMQHIFLRTAGIYRFLSVEAQAMSSEA